MSITGPDRIGLKHHRVELSLRALLRGFGLKVADVSQGRFTARVRELVGGHSHHPTPADDFPAIRARLEELRREGA